MQLLVTGGCGFIGTHFIETMLSTYPDVSITNLDALTYAAHPDTNPHLIAIGGDRYRFVQGDIASPLASELIAHGNFDAVINFAAETHVDRSILDPEAFVRTNIVGVQNILLAAKKAGKTRFVQVSTDEVYGSLAPEEETFTEASNLSPNSPYAASKAAADLLILASHRTYGQDVVITRCTNNYGPYQFPEKLLPLLIANALEDLPVPVYGDGRQVRDWIHVVDHCRGIDAVLRRGKAGEVYNISASEERPNIDMVHRILDRLQKPRSLVKYVGDRPGHDRRYGLSSERITKELGWKPQFTFENGLEATVTWYLDNQAWWKKLRGKDYYNYYQANYKDKMGNAIEGSPKQ